MWGRFTTSSAVRSHCSARTTSWARSQARNIPQMLPSIT